MPPHPQTYSQRQCQLRMVCSAHTWTELDSVLGRTPRLLREEVILLHELVSCYQVGGARDGAELWKGYSHSADGPLHICSPIKEISTWAAHCEHLIVGRNADSLAMAMASDCLSLLPIECTQICRYSGSSHRVSAPGGKMIRGATGRISVLIMRHQTR